MAYRLRRSAYFADEGFPLALVRVADHAPGGEHRHDFVELVMILSGRGVHVVGGEKYEIAAGDVFVIDRGRLHQFVHAQGMEVVNILFDIEGLSVPTADLRTLPGYHVLFGLEAGTRRRAEYKRRLLLSAEELTHAAGLAERLERELAERRPGHRFLALAAFMDLVGRLSRVCSEVPTPDSRSLLRVGEVIAFMEERYAEPMTVAKLARIAHLSERSLQREFRRAVGASPIEHLLKLRVRRAADLLRAGRANVTEAAFAVGFSDGNYFSRQFRRIVGVSPGEYRRKR